MNRTLETILSSGKVVNKFGETFDLHSTVDREEGELLYNTIKNDTSVQNTLEIGCAYGISSLFICEALKGRGTHTILDPFQDKNWHGVGVENLRREGIDFFNHIPEHSELAMPKLLADGKRFDLIFIDGCHTFDHCLVDAFYSTRLLNVGGYLAFDDVAYPAIGRVVKYFLNYTCYELHREIVNRPSWKGRLLGYRSSTTMVVLRKVSEDKRSWDWYDDKF